MSATAASTSTLAPAPVPTLYSQEYLQQDSSRPLTNAIIILWVICTVAMILRTAARIIQRTPLMWGDVFMAVSYVAMIGLFVTGILCIQNGAGRHVAALSDDQLIRFLIVTHYVMPFPYLAATSLPKLAVLEVYIRFFVLDRIPRYISFLTGLAVVINAIVNMVLAAVQCAPMAFLWDTSIPGGYCLNAQQHFLWGSVTNIVTDVIILILPIPQVIKLKSSWRVKGGILATFVLASVGLIFSVLRFIGFDRSYDDGTFIAPIVIIATLVEPAVYLVAACLLTFRPLFRLILRSSFFNSLRGTMFGSEHRSGTQGTTLVDTVKENDINTTNGKNGHLIHLRTLDDELRYLENITDTSGDHKGNLSYKSSVQQSAYAHQIYTKNEIYPRETEQATEIGVALTTSTIVVSEAPKAPPKYEYQLPHGHYSAG